MPDTSPGMSTPVGTPMPISCHVLYSVTAARGGPAQPGRDTRDGHVAGIRDDVPDRDPAHTQVVGVADLRRPNEMAALSRMRVLGVTTLFSRADVAVSIFITEPGS